MLTLKLENCIINRENQKVFFKLLDAFDKMTGIECEIEIGDNTTFRDLRVKAKRWKKDTTKYELMELIIKKQMKGNR